MRVVDREFSQIGDNFDLSVDLSDLSAANI